MDSTVGGHSGVGGAVDGCAWDSNFATSTPGVAFVQGKHFVDATDRPCDP